MNEDMEKMLQEAPAPTLTLEPFTEEKEEPAVVEKEEAVQPVDEKEKIKAILTPQEQKQVDAFVKQIDITNSQMVLQYGASSQKKIADFSESALGNVRTKDLGEIGNELTAVVNELKSIEDGDEEKGFLGLFKKGGNKIANMKAKYAKAEVNVDKICKVLEGHQIQLLKDAAMLDQMYQLNLTYYKELSFISGNGMFTERAFYFIHDNGMLLERAFYCFVLLISISLLRMVVSICVSSASASRRLFLPSS